MTKSPGLGEPSHPAGEFGSDGQLSRRALLSRAATGALMVGGGSLLYGCSSGGGSPSATTAGGTPRRGGVLRVGIAGGSPGDTLDAGRSFSLVDFARARQLYEPLFIYGLDGTVQNVLATEFSPNADATVWTLRIRPDVRFHDGKPLTVDDVLFTFRRNADPKQPLAFGFSLATVDLRRAKKLDPHTLQLPCTTPNSALRALMADMMILPQGYNPNKPVGTGPFVYHSFTPGRQSVFRRNPHYWQNGLPYVDEVVIVDYTDETSQINALIAGQLDAVDQLTATGLRTVEAGGKKTIIAEGGAMTPFTMRVDMPPFNDARVREAMRLLVDRTQLRDAVFGPHGLAGNDLYGRFDPAYDTAIPQRERDLEKARALLKAAGRSDLTVSLPTSPVAPGFVDSAQVFAQQASEAGVTVRVRQLPTTDFFKGYLSYPLAQTVYNTFTILHQTAVSMLPTAPYNECHWADPRFVRLAGQALATTDSARQTELLREMQQILWSDGGYIISSFTPNLDGISTRLQGVVPSKAGWALSDYAFKNFWFA
jgi:peptide/nickel transport system substrate-binding protein